LTVGVLPAATCWQDHRVPAPDRGFGYRVVSDLAALLECTSAELPRFESLAGARVRG
jgi:hypothetical protein